MDIIAGLIERALNNRTDAHVLKQVSEDVKALCARFPLYPELT
jgi:glycine/serine hydroxymethyltransferase